MSRLLISILLFVSVLAMGQVTRGYSFQTTPTSSVGGAESRWMCEDDGTDEEENHTISLYGSASWDNADSEPEGSYSLNANCANCGATVPSINYTSTFTIAGEALKWGGTADVVLFATMQSSDGWEVLFDPGNERLGFTSGNGSSTSTSWGDAMSDLSGDWFMWMAVVDYPNETVQFYIDGVDAGQAEITYTPTTYTSTARIGIDFGDTDEIFGEVDALQVYTWKLTSTDAGTINTTPGTEVFE